MQKKNFSNTFVHSLVVDMEGLCSSLLSLFLADDAISASDTATGAQVSSSASAAAALAAYASTQPARSLWSSGASLVPPLMELCLAGAASEDEMRGRLHGVVGYNRGGSVSALASELLPPPLPVVNANCRGGSVRAHAWASSVRTASSGTDELRYGPARAIERCAWSPASQSGPASCSRREGWSATAECAASWWAVSLPAPAFVARVDVAWATSSTVRSLPGAWALSSSSDFGKTWVRLGPSMRFNPPTATGIIGRAQPTPGAAASSCVSSAAVGAVVTAIRIDMFGFSRWKIQMWELAAAKSSGHPTVRARCHGIASVRVLLPDTQAPRLAPSSTLNELQALLARAAPISVKDDGGVAAVRGLLGLALAAGSFQGLLACASALLAHPLKESASLLGLCHDGKLLIDAAVNEELESPQLLAEQEKATPSAVARFDDAEATAGIAITDRGRLFTSPSGTSTGRSCAYGVTGFSSGRAMWEFVSVVDVPGDEYLCFGCGVKPRSSDHYDTSPNLWTIRAYNGEVHQGAAPAWPLPSAPAVAGGSHLKIHQSDVVRFDLDCEAGTVRVSINSVDMGIVFNRGLVGREIFPVVAAYKAEHRKGERSAFFQRCEVVGASRSYASIPLVSDDYKLLSPANGLDHEIVAGTLADDAAPSNARNGEGRHVAVAQAVTVCGVVYPCCLSLRNELMASVPTTFARYNLEQLEAASARPDHPREPLEYLLARLAVDDSSQPGARPLVFVAIVDGEVAYKSPVLRSPGDMTYMRVRVAGAKTVELQARAPESDVDANDNLAASVVKAAVLEARFVERRPWSSSAHLRGGALPRPVSGSTLASSLCLAHHLLCRLAALTEAQDEATRRCVRAAARLSRATGVPASAGLRALLVAGEALAGLAGEAANDPFLISSLPPLPAPPIARKSTLPAAFALVAATPVVPSSTTQSVQQSQGAGACAEAAVAADVAAAADLSRVLGPLCLDVCGASLDAMAALLRVLAPRAELAADTQLASPGFPTEHEDASWARAMAQHSSVARPYAAMTCDVLNLVRSHLLRLVASDLDTAALAACAVAGRGSGDGGCGASAGYDDARLCAMLRDNARALGDSYSNHTAVRSGQACVLLPMVTTPNALPTLAAAELATEHGAGGELASLARALSSLHQLLRDLVDGAGEEPADVRAAAASALDTGAAIFYSSAAARRDMLARLVDFSRSGGGAVLELQLRFPPPATAGVAAAPATGSGVMAATVAGTGDALVASVAARIARDARPERAVLLLQLEAARLGLPVTVHAAWGHFAHVLVDLSPAAAGSAAVSSALELLERGLARVFSRSGLGRWMMPAGCTDTPVPFLLSREPPTAASRALSKDNFGIARLHTRTAGTFATIDAAVLGFIDAAGGVRSGAEVT